MKPRARRIFRPQAPAQVFDQIRISIASPDRILSSVACGEIEKPETIDYRSLAGPSATGCFCARIFGPIKDYECLCGKYKRMKYKGIVCEKCSVEDDPVARAARAHGPYRAGHAGRAYLVLQSRCRAAIGCLLDMTLTGLERIVYFEYYVVLEPGR